MPVLFRIAVRNLRQHSSKSLIIGIIIAVGVMILVIGNTLIHTIDTGIERAFIDNYTGNIMITGITKSDISIFAVQSPGGFEDTPSIPDYEKVLNYVKDISQVESYTSQISGFGLISVEGSDDDKGPYVGMLFGINPEEYPKLFSNVEIEKGHYLSSGEEGVLMSQSNIDSMNEVFGGDLDVGDKILITSMGSAGFKIREVPIVGIYGLKYDSEAAEYITYIDAQTLRVLKGMNLGNQGEVALSDDETALLDSSSMDTMFSNDSIGGEAELDFEMSDENIFDIIDLDTGTEESKPTELKSEEHQSKKWEYILVKTKTQRDAAGVIARLNAWFNEEGIKAHAYNWKAAAGPFSSTADVIRIVFIVAIILVAVVAIIIMTNTLVINVVERTAEIGTMRALGAHKNFVRRMFSIEVLTISVVFGLIGMIAGVITLFIVKLIGIEASNAFLEILFAGSVLKPVYSFGSVIGSWFTVVVIAMIANIYPLRLALKVQPIKAMMSE
ncbi:MAG: FtsX-like permease family protein [Spirochaetales bacterium]|nr:FtsX-like permease family protein [Spirochaetales bacterium]